MWPTLGFIGGGQMARALARGFFGADLPLPSPCVVFDPSAAAADQFAREVKGARIASSNAEVVQESELIVLAVKPQNFTQVAAELTATSTEEKLFVSILAGVPLARLTEQLRTSRVVRVMPNTPCLVGAGAAGFSLGAGATQEDAERIDQLLGCVGVAFALEETQLDAVTGLSGSGPAYIYTVIEALSDGGVRMGLPRAVATKLAAQTVQGAAQMVIATDEHPAVLRERVTSPGGTTSAGLHVLEQQALRAALIDAVRAATERSKELGQS